MQKLLYKISYKPSSSPDYLAMQPFPCALLTVMVSVSGICSFALPSHFPIASDLVISLLYIF